MRTLIKLTHILQFLQQIIVIFINTLTLTIFPHSSHRLKVFAVPLVSGCLNAVAVNIRIRSSDHLWERKWRVIFLLDWIFPQAGQLVLCLVVDRAEPSSFLRVSEFPETEYLTYDAEQRYNECIKFPIPAMF